MLLQANDFRHLYEHHDVELQIGGSDQWGNIIAGVDLIRRAPAARRPGLTWPLLTRGRRHEVRQDGRRARCGSTRRATIAVPVPPVLDADATTRWSATYLRCCSLRPLDEIERADRGARRGARAPPRPSGPRRRDDRAGARPGGRRQPPRRPPTCSSAAIRRGASQAALEAVAAEVPSSRCPPSARRRCASRAARRRPASGQSNGEARRRSARARCVQRQSRARRGRPARGVRPAPRAVTCCSARASDVPPRRKCLRRTG